MDCQSVFAETFRHDFHDALGIAMIAEPNYEIIRIADEEGTASQTRFHFMFEPEIQHIVQEHVRNQRLNHTALGRPGVRVTHVTILHHARFQPLVDQTQQHAITHPQSEKLS